LRLIIIQAPFLAAVIINGKVTIGLIATGFVSKFSIAVGHQQKQQKQEVRKFKN
jgi:hypothetical protein